MTTAMLNFLLSFNHEKEVKLGKWMLDNHIDFELMRKHVYSLVRSGLLTSSEKVLGPSHLTDDVTLQLNLEFTP